MVGNEICIFGQAPYPVYTRLVEDTAWLSACTERQSTSFSEWIIDRTSGQTMLYLTCSMIPSVDLARYGVSPDKDLGIFVKRMFLRAK